MSARNFFTPEQQKQIRQAIEEAEQSTSGEIRVHLEDKCKEDVLDHAAYIFKALHMHKTKLRNGVLFYLSTDDHKFAILGDAGINTKVPPGFWNNIKEHTLAQFKAGKVAEGLCEGIRMAGEQLKAHFPLGNNDPNELINEISFGGKK